MPRNARDRDKREFAVLKLPKLKREDRNLYCSLCNSDITTLDERITVQSKHEHVFMNPAGRIYRIGCFGTAPGCLQAGTRTEECTWFAGYSWRYAICAHCNIHLGWVYNSPTKEVFFGLILSRLISIGESSRN